MANKTIIVDPITRIEGHLRIEVVVDDNNVVTDAFSSSTLWRGIERIVQGRDPRDAGFFTQRICGVCTFSHYKAGIMAVENALGIVPPLNAVLVRSLMTMALFLHDHIVHFYQLHALDFVDLMSALKADPKAAAQEAFKYTDLPLACGEDNLKAVQERIKKFAAKGDLGIFANGYYGNKAYRFTPEQNLIGLSHYLECLRIQRIAARLMAIFGGKNPHPQSLSVGGVTCVMDLLDPSRLGEYLSQFNEVVKFVDRAYYPDLIMSAKVYRYEPSVINDIGVPNFIAYQEIPLSASSWLFESGVILNGDISKVYDIDEMQIKEDVTHSWYKGDKPLQPYNGQTIPEYTGFKDGKSLNGKGEMVETKNLNPAGKYSWIKAPRYNSLPMQVGPLPNIIINYAKGNKYIVPIVDKFLKDSGLPLPLVFSTLGRTACRMLEAKAITTHGLIGFNNLVDNIKIDQSTYTTYHIDNSKEYKGRYIGDAPRGMLSHWCRIKNGVIENWQAVVPSTWNASPMDAHGRKGSYEACLIGLKINDLTQPLEIIRKIHSYDPCIACAVHVMDTKGNKMGEYKLNV